MGRQELAENHWYAITRKNRSLSTDQCTWEVQQKMWDWHKRDRENDSLAAIAGQTTWTRWQRSPDNGQCISVYLVVVAVASAVPSPPPDDYCLVVAVTMNKKDCEVWFDMAEEQESMSHVNTKDHFISTERAQWLSAQSSSVSVGTNKLLGNLLLSVRVKKLNHK